MTEPTYELALNPRLVQKAQKRLEKTAKFDSLRELLDSLLEEWLKETS